jgi:hypothetical protein
VVVVEEEEEEEEMEVLVEVVVVVVVVVNGALDHAQSVALLPFTLTSFTRRCDACVIRPSVLWLTCACGGNLVVKVEDATAGTDFSSSKQYCCSYCGQVPSDSRMQMSLK